LFPVPTGRRLVGSRGVRPVLDDGVMPLEAGDEIDGWSLLEPLGSGGNGEVWRAVHDVFGEAALKVLSRRKGDRWQRFCDEVQVMENLAGTPGLLPLVAAHLPESPSTGKAWLATKVAKKAVIALGPAPTLLEVVAVGQAYAATLARLVAQHRVVHRDLKPDNLFWRDGQWEVGDFGLVDFPGKTPVTAGNRRLGPLYFIAPEMLREPDQADGGSADVFSLAKTLWVFATGQTYPPDGQIRAEVPSHALAHFVDEPGALALSLILQAATTDAATARPTMAEFATHLSQWLRADPDRDDSAAEELRLQDVRSLRDQLAETLDPQAFVRIENELRDAISEARAASNERQREVLRGAFQQGQISRRKLIEDYGVKAAIDLHDNPWIGSARSGEDFEYAILSRPLEGRRQELVRARQQLLARRFWWVHSVALAGSIGLRGQAGCEPLATEIAKDEIRNHLLEFSDQPALAAAWRFQRAAIPATMRIAAFAPLDDLARHASARQSAEDRIRRPIGAGRVMMDLAQAAVRAQMQATSWLPEELNKAADAAEEVLASIPVPASPWNGPAGDPWLQSWAECSPLVMVGLSILSGSPSADDLLADPKLREIIVESATRRDMLGRAASRVAARLGVEV
jgi:hypothetical protein